jgi:hypothetical protein
MMRSFAVLLAVAIGACAGPLQMSYPDVRVAPARLVGIPPVIHSFEIDGDGQVVPKEGRQEIAEGLVEQSLNFRVSKQGGRYFDDDGLENVDHFTDLREWATASLAQILRETHARQTGRKTRHEGIRQWAFPAPPPASWRTALGADYVLVSLFIDGSNTGGRTALNVLATGFGGTTIEARREAIACAVSLADGHLVWCDTTTVSSLESRKEAQIVVDALTAGLFGKKSPKPTDFAGP